MNADPAQAGGRPRDRDSRDRKREDHALALIEDLESISSDLSRVRRILLELGRFYCQVMGGPIMGVPEQRAIVEAPGRGAMEEARALIKPRYALYIEDRARLGRSADG